MAIVLITQEQEKKNYIKIRKLIRELLGYYPNKPLPKFIINGVEDIAEKYDCCKQAILIEMTNHIDEIKTILSNNTNLEICFNQIFDLISKNIKDTDKNIKDEIQKKKFSRPTMIEQQEFDDLYMYVKVLMGYDENQALSKDMVLKLKGLQTNQYMLNNNQKATSNYSYKTIMNTFKVCSIKIRKALAGNKFTDENHKFNYILVIVRNNLHEIAAREKRLEKANEKAKNIEVATPVNDDNYVTKGKALVGGKYEKYW